jgi:hypothetical protein
LPSMLSLLSMSSLIVSIFIRMVWPVAFQRISRKAREKHEI